MANYYVIALFESVKNAASVVPVKDYALRNFTSQEKCLHLEHNETNLAQCLQNRVFCIVILRKKGNNITKNKFLVIIY